jgi:L-amino acid N-acyltransferase YncA
MTEELTIRSATAADASQVTAIYNQGIEERCATFETQPRHLEDLVQRIADQERYPLLVAVDRANVVLGWASLSSYRPRACYGGIAEFSIYLDRGARGRGRGIGQQLLPALIDAAQAHGYWKLVSRSFTFNAASRALCHACGFREIGIYEKHGRLDDRWLDAVVVERLIPEILSAVDTAVQP